MYIENMFRICDQCCVVQPFSVGVTFVANAHPARFSVLKFETSNFHSFGYKSETTPRCGDGAERCIASRCLWEVKSEAGHSAVLDGDEGAAAPGDINGGSAASTRCLLPGSPFFCG
jgi:hypothetical protein